MEVSLERIGVCLKGEVLFHFVVTHMHNKSFIYFVFFFFTGCQLILGHAVDRDLLLLVQGEVRGLIKDYNTFEKYLAALRDQDKSKGTALDEHHKRLEALEEKLQEASENRREEIKKVLERLLSFERQSSKRLQEVEEKVDQLEQAQTKTDDRVGQLEQSQTDTAVTVDLLKHSHTKTADEVELLKHSHTKTADEVELLRHSHTETATKVARLEQNQTETADVAKRLKHSHIKTADEVELLKHSRAETAAKVDQLGQRCAGVEEFRMQIKPQNDKPGKLSL